jgi:hypothetical protein
MGHRPDIHSLKKRLMRLKAVLILVVLFLAACARAGATVTPAQPTPPRTAPATETVTMRATATTAAVPTITPVPTPVPAKFAVEPQTIGEDGRLVFTQVSLPVDGWLAVFADDEGRRGQLLGHIALAAGAFDDVEVTVDPHAITTTLWASLHEDSGTLDRFDFPGADQPLDGGAAEQTFEVEIDLPRSTIEVSDQQIAEDGFVTIDRLVALQPGWLVIHRSESDAAGAPIGQAPVAAGEHEDLVVPVRWRDATNQLFAVLHEDREQPGGFDGRVDVPLVEEGETVLAEFSAGLPPDIAVYDQPVVDGTLTLERVISRGPGWVAISQDVDGQPGFVVGSAPLVEGVNELVQVEVERSLITPLLYLTLHEDTDGNDEFNYPADDPVIGTDGRPLPPFLLRTNPGNYLITADQAISADSSVVVPLTVADLDTWLVIYAGAGQPEEIIGQTWLPAGMNRSVPVTIQPVDEGETLFAVLHLDGQPIGQFNFPDGPDVPLLRNRAILASPFTLLDPTQNRPLSPG